MNYSDRITELNFDTENEEAQKEAKALRKKLMKRAGLYLGISISGLVLSVSSFILLAVFTFKGYTEGLLFSIIPLACALGFACLLLLGGYYKGLARSIILSEESEKNK